MAVTHVRNQETLVYSFRLPTVAVMSSLTHVAIFFCTGKFTFFSR